MGIIKLMPVVFEKEELPTFRLREILSVTSNVFRCASTAASTTLSPQNRIKKTTE
jgi:hypothetical protein